MGEQQNAAAAQQDAEAEEAEQPVEITTGVYFKKGSLLHEQVLENKRNVRASVSGLKELNAKKARATTSRQSKTIKDEIGRAIYHVANNQGSYFHKTGPVPQSML